MKRTFYTKFAISVLYLTLLNPSNAFSTEISISRISTIKSGDRGTATIIADDIASEISSFNLLIAHDQSLGMVLNIRPGDLHKDFGWEYFTYRQITRDSVEAHMPSFKTSLLNIVGIASLVGNTPPSVDTDSVTLVSFDVITPLTIGSFSDEVWVPFSFFWRDCNDNVLTSINGDTVYTASGLFENRASSNPRDPVSYSFPGFGIPDSACSAPEGKEVSSRVDFVNSGIWFFVYDPVEECLNGDLNCNGIPYELTDVQIFINIFLYGLGACVCPLQECIKQSNANCDGVALTVSDLVYMIRVMIREKQLAFHKPQYISSTPPYLSLADKGNVILVNDVDVAGVLAKVYPKKNSVLSISDFNVNNPNLSIGQNGDTINIVMADFEDNTVFDAGQNLLFNYTGDTEIEIVGSAVDIYGYESTLKFESVTLPQSPILLQNYPNPFNPSTTIEFSLPIYTDWSIDIYNVTGQLIRRFSGASVGNQEIIWDGTNLDGTPVSSGVYFYKLISSDETISRKMLLLK